MADSWEGEEPYAKPTESGLAALTIITQLMDPSSDWYNPAVVTSLSLEQRAALLELAFVGLHVPKQTAVRVAKWLEEYSQSINQASPYEVRGVFGPLFTDPHNEMVIVKDISFTALCVHHLLPFTGHAAIGYVPNGQVMGLSKAARLVGYFCQAPTLQEHITSSIANAMVEVLRPAGATVVLYNVMHSCMTMRGVKDPDANTTTSAVRGVFREDAQARNEFLALLSK